MENEEFYELTSPQKNIWLVEQFYNNTNINNIVGYLRIGKKANLKALEQAFNHFIKQNDAFRIQLVLKDNIPMQKFSDYQPQEIDVIELKNESQLREFELSFPMKKIDIMNSPLFIGKILHFPNGTGILAVSSHHLISDAWTMTLLLEQIYKNYMDIVNKRALVNSPMPSYIDFILSQKKYLSSAKFEKDSEYWQEQFETMPNVVSFKNTTSTSVHSNRKTYKFSKKTLSQIHTFCQNNNISDYIFLLSVFSIYFASVFNCDNFIVGNPILNRINHKEKETAGMFVSVMPFIIDVDKTLSFSDFCKQNSLKQKKMYRHIHFPYHNILDYIRNKHDFSDSLYDIVFSYQNAASPSYCKWLPNHSQAESLQIHIKNIDTEHYTLAIFYDYLTDLFSEKDIDLMHKRILGLISQILQNENIEVNNLEIISNSEKKLLLDNFNNTHSLYNKNSNIPKEFEKIVKKFPKNIAVSDSRHSYTYEELNNRANYLADYILSLKLDTKIIAFSLPRSIDLFVTILAILKSGHTYMPIDPEYPIDRINFMLENSQTGLLITTHDLITNIKFNKSIIFFDKIKFDKIVPAPKVNIQSNSPCYIMYTSGSTGVPKAVIIKHYNVLNFVKSMQKRLDYSVSPNNKILSVTTICFDIFVFETFPTLLSGLTLVIADELESRNPKLLSKLIEEKKIAKILTTPSRIELLFSDNSYLDSLSTIKEFILGGEPLTQSFLKKLKEHTKANIYNLYGPTETTVYSTFKDMTFSENITIGKPINNTKIYVLTDNNKLQPINQIGEICIGGDGVGDGYYLNEEKTNMVFVKNPYTNKLIYKTGDLGYWKSNGELVCLGRKDHQVKIRGYRVELDDISSNIMTFDNIENCVVIDRNDKLGKKFLCAYFTSNKKIDVKILKKYLVDILPNYMIPSYFMQIDQIPLTINHKIDRKSLPEPNINISNISTEYVSPSTDTEKNLCKIFESSLRLEKIGIENDIFDYHIDSLDIIRVQTKMLDYNYKLNTQDFYQCRTIRNLSNLIDNQNHNSISEVDIKNLSNMSASFNKHPANMNFRNKKYNNILLLGCNGYLGIHILNEFIENTNSKISCILRTKNELTISERLSKLYRFYFNKELPIDRIEFIESDITLSCFGLSSEKYSQLAQSVDLVINCAANVKYYGDYTKFKKINVDVVDNCIKLSDYGNIEFVHISTLGVSGNYLVDHQKNYNSFDENDFYIGQRYDDNVYIKTKFEAEELIFKSRAEKNTLKSSIFRVGNLTSRYCDGTFQQNFNDNAFYNILMLILKYHIIPNTVLTQFLEFTPVDYCAKAVFELVTNLDISNYVFHLFNENYINVADLLKIFEERGFKTTVLSGNDFKKAALSLCNSYPNENILKGIVNDLDDDLGLSFKSSVNQKNLYTNNYLNNLNFHWPEITENYIYDIIKYLRQKNLLN